MMNSEFFIPAEIETLPAARPPLKEYPQNFVMELALGLESPDALCIRYDITLHEYSQLTSNPTFQTDLNNWRSRMADEGLSFKLKARVQAESYLADIDDIITSQSTSPETKLAAISRVVQWGGLESKGDNSSGSNKPSVTINITRFSDNTKEAIEIN